MEIFGNISEIISEKGKEALENEDYAKVVAFYRNENV